MEHTKDTPGPFDAFATAKPNEPIFTLQGGDPLAAPLVLEWSNLARKLGLEMQGTGDRALASKGRALLLKSTEAEEIAWSMDAYRKGFEEVEEDAPQEAQIEDEDKVRLRIQEHHERVEASRELSNAAGCAAQAAEVARKYGLPDVAAEVDDLVPRLQRLRDLVRGSFRLG